MSFSDRSSRNSSSGLPLSYIAISIVITAVLVLGFVGCFGTTTTGPGVKTIVRNGGPIDNSDIRGIIPPASGLTWKGMFSKLHPYPVQQRFYSIQGDGGGDRRSAPGVDIVRVPTSDGVDVGLEGTIFFTLNTEDAVLKAFDEKFGTRTFATPDGDLLFPWEGDSGWSAWLDRVVRPLIDNDLREQVASFRCADLVSSCALVQNSGQAAYDIEVNAGEENNANIAKIQDAINASLPRNLQAELDGQWLTNIHFNLTRVTLPAEVQHEVDTAQAEFAGITAAQARVQQAKADAQANEERQKGYDACSICGSIDLAQVYAEAIKGSNLQTFAPGGDFAVTQRSR